MITLYHIKGKKWGATSQKLVKRLKDQNLKLTDVCETIIVETIEEADILEEKLNIENGYSWKASEKYSHMIKIAAENRTCSWTNEHRSRGGKTSGRIAVETGQLKSVCSEGGKVGGKTAGKLQSQKEYTCPNCNRTGRGNRFVGHINKCK
jgi:hypothetical protein